MDGKDTIEAFDVKVLVYLFGFNAEKTRNTGGVCRVEVGSQWGMREGGLVDVPQWMELDNSGRVIGDGVRSPVIVNPTV